MADGKYVILEVNMRPPGGLTTDMWNFANDIDIYAAYAGVVVYNHFEPEFHRPYFCAYIGRRNGRTYKLKHDQVLHAFGEQMALHQPISGVFAPALGDYGYLIRSPDLDEVQAIIQAVQQKGA